MNIDRMVIAGINYPIAIKRLNGKTELYHKLLHCFIIDENFNDLEKFLNNKEYDEAFNACHTFKGIVGNLSMSRLYQKVIILTDYLRYQEYDKAVDLFPKVKEEYTQILIVLKDELEKK